MSYRESRTVHVWHDLDGTIVAWGYQPENPPFGLVAAPLARGDVGVIHADVEVEALHSLHESHEVDVASGELRRRAADSSY